MGGIRSTVLTAAAALSACGALDDISEMNREVKSTNRNMSELLTLYRGTDQKITDSLEEVKKTNANLAQQLEYSKSMEGSLEATLNGFGQMLESIRGLTEQGQLTGSQLKATVDQLHQMLGRLNAASDTLEALKAQGIGNKAALERLIVLTRQAKNATQQMLGQVGAQKLSILADKMRDFTENVRNNRLPNDFRVASAIAVFELLDRNEEALAESGGGGAGDWYRTWVAANIETCRSRVGNASGDVCTPLFLGKIGELLHPQIDDVSSDLREIMEARPALGDLVPLPRIRTNFVWALALTPASAGKLFRYVAADRVNPLARKGREFLAVARRMSIEFLANVTRKETPKHELEAQDLATVLQRVEIVQAIQRLPEMADVKSAAELNGMIGKLLDRIARRAHALDGEDRKFVERIRVSVSSPTA